MATFCRAGGDEIALGAGLRGQRAVAVRARSPEVEAGGGGEG